MITCRIGEWEERWSYIPLCLAVFVYTCTYLVYQVLSVELHKIPHTSFGIPLFTTEIFQIGFWIDFSVVIEMFKLTDFTALTNIFVTIMWFEIILFKAEKYLYGLGHTIRLLHYVGPCSATKSKGPDAYAVCITTEIVDLPQRSSCFKQQLLCSITVCSATCNLWTVIRGLSDPQHPRVLYYLSLSSKGRKG